MAVYKGTSGSTTTDGGTGDDYISGIGGDDLLRGQAGNDIIYGDLFGETIPIRTVTIANATPLYQWVDPQLGSATSSSAGGSTSYTFVSNSTYRFDVHYVEPDGTLTVVASVPSIGSSRTINGYPSNAKFIISNYDTGELVDWVSLSATNSTYTHSTNIAGDDTLIGNVGEDFLFGNGGNDILYGGNGSANSNLVETDHLYGGEGDDRLYGGAGDDVLDGGDGADKLYGEVGNDALLGADGNDTIEGGDGDDAINAGAGNDSAHGQDGDDFVSGLGGDDVLRGGNGNDVIYGDLIGETIPIRTVFINASEPLVKAVDANLGSATSSSTGGSTSYTFVSNSTYRFDIHYVEPNGTLTLVASVPSTGMSRTINGYPDDANFVLSNYDTGELVDWVSLNSLDATYTHDTVIPGDDTLIGNAGKDYLYGNAGDDIIYGGNAEANSNQEDTDRLFGGDGNDTLFGALGDDYLDGGNGSDILYGEAGNDRLVGGGGADTLSGGDGEDILFGDNIFIDTSLLVAKSSIIPGVLSDSNGTYGSAVDYGDTTVSQVTYSFTQNLLSFERVFYVNPNGDLVYLGSVPGGQTANFTVPQGAKFVFVDPTTGVIIGATETSLDPTAGVYQTGNYGDPDFYQNFSGADDIIDGGAGNDIISGEIGNDTLTGGLGDDVVYGDIGDDTISGNEGNDTLVGGSGDDLIYGNALGADTAVDGADIIRGGEGDDTLYGQAGNDNISGGMGNDILDGGAGSDILYGETGNDTISGQDGDDIIYGDGFPILLPRTGASDYQANVLEPAAGSDAFLDARDDGVTPTTNVTFDNTSSDFITLYYVNPDGSVESNVMGIPAGQSRTFELPNGADVIAVDGGLNGSGQILGYYQNVDTAAVGTSGNPTVQLVANQDLAQFVPAGGADILSGGAGNDTIFGGDAADQISGDQGNDTIDGEGGNDVINGGDGNDVITGGDGDDTITAGRGDNVTGNADRDTFLIDVTQAGSGDITIDGSTESTAPGDVDDFDVIDVTASGLQRVSVTRTLDADGNSYSGTLVVTDGTNNYTVNFTEIEKIICFARGTLIETLNGHVPVEDLKLNDLVLTKDNFYQPIRWIRGRSVSKGQLKKNPKLYPIRISKGALGHNYPSSDLYLSAQHRILIRSVISERMFDTDEVLIPAKKLLNVDGVDWATECDEVDYFHFMFDEHEIVFSNGAETESLLPGIEALEAVGLETRAELLALFPTLFDRTVNAETARYIPDGKFANRLVARHVKHNLQLR